MKTLILGGARSGKSVVAERLAERSGVPVTYVATVRLGEDQDLVQRVAAHRERRPPEWSTIECGDDLADVLTSTSGTVLVDSLGPWLAALPGLRCDLDVLVAALQGRGGDTIIVSEEVGLGVHPETAVGREFRDALGTLNQAIAHECDDVLLVVAGRSLSLPRDAS
ncbi:MAG TPA: bifunctional adenosylcobinamide kinase/adenosylcobinamide-phosphate guanylyltransferase [Acidimicrobiales bacterium]|nr:bifunctional adenosylcobinamide kinase/adenosylcobinamide-phosphate guanylyltransferase [Acidimicrobiales bacterium]